MSGSLKGWKVPKPTGHPGWCRVIEAHDRDECSTDPNTEQQIKQAAMRRRQEVQS